MIKHKVTMGVAAAAFAMCAFPLSGEAHRWSPAINHYAPNESCWSEGSGQMTNNCSTNQLIYLPAATDAHDYTSDSEAVAVFAPTVNGVAQAVQCAAFGAWWNSTGFADTSGTVSSTGAGFSIINLPYVYIPVQGSMFLRCSVPPNGRVVNFNYDG